MMMNSVEMRLLEPEDLLKQISGSSIPELEASMLKAAESLAVGRATSVSPTPWREEFGRPAWRPCF